MTTHAHDPAASTLVTVRESGPGSTACTVDRLHARSATTPLVALDLIPDGNSPLLAVQLLVRSAVLAARGVVVHGGGPAPGDDAAAEPGAGPGVTVLDPTRPGRCLLQRLTRAIPTCCLLTGEHLEPAALPDPGDRDRMDAARDHFDAAVRVEAARTAERLGTAA